MRVVHQRVGSSPMVSPLGWLALGQLDVRLGLRPGADDVAEQRKPQAVAVGLAAVLAPGQQPQRLRLQERPHRLARAEVIRRAHSAFSRPFAHPLPLSGACSIARTVSGPTISATERRATASCSRLPSTARTRGCAISRRPR